MKWNPPNLSVLIPLDEKIEPIRKEIESCQKKLTTILNKREKMLNAIEQEAIAALPKNRKRWTKEQWEWVLETGHGESQAHYKFKSAIFEELGLACFGFLPDTKQPSVAIHGSQGFDKNKILASLNILLPHLKPVTVKDTYHGEETGVRLDLHGIEEGWTSTVYVHNKGDVSLYVDRYSEPKDFPSLKAMFDWYEIKVKG